MLSIRNLTYQVGEKILYQEASLHVKRADRIGLIGPNGSGKSTLFKLIMNKVQPTSGVISISKGYQIGWLHQELASVQLEGNVDQVVMEGLEKLLALKKRRNEMKIDGCPTQEVSLSIRRVSVAVSPAASCPKKGRGVH